MRDIIQIVLAGLLFLLGLLIGAHLSRTEVRLVGYGCLGARGPIYAAEEDHMPQCLTIEEV
jgi:hypothetical protein